MERFLNLRFYLAPLPDPNFQFTKLTLLIGLLLIIAGIAFGIYRKKYLKDIIAKKILKIYPGRLKIYGFLVLLLLVFREQGIPFLSMRLWWFVLLAFFLYTFIKLALKYKKEYAKRKERMRKNTIKKKYLPKKKR